MGERKEERDVAEEKDEEQESGGGCMRRVRRSTKCTETMAEQIGEEMMKKGERRGGSNHKDDRQKTR